MSGMQPDDACSFCYNHHPPPSAPSLSPNPNHNPRPREFLRWDPAIQLPSMSSFPTPESPYPSYSYDPESSQFPPHKFYYYPYSPLHFNGHAYFGPEQQFSDPLQFNGYAYFGPEQQFSDPLQFNGYAYFGSDSYPLAYPMHDPNSNPLFSPIYESEFEYSRSDLYENKLQTGFSDADGFNDDAHGDAGGKVEPYGARGIEGPSTSKGSLGYDYESGEKITRAMPKADAQQDVNNGLQKFRVKLLPEESGSTMDVICEIALDGIRLLDPSTNRTLRIYPLLTVTRWEAIDPSIFCLWAKSSVDIKPRRVRLQSNQYTTKTILDAAIAAKLQLKEMQRGLSHMSGATDAQKQSTQPPEEKKGLIDWMNQKKPANEEKHHWVPDEAASKCACGTHFHAFLRKHHCRKCGGIFCNQCTLGRIALTADENAQPVRVCDTCLTEVTYTMSHGKNGATTPASLQSHEDLAQKLQEAMDISRKTSTGSESDGSMQQMEVACPTCTVHLQVQLPVSVSQTIECGVCQHPFILTAP